MKLTWKVVLKGLIRLLLLVLGCVIAGGVAYMILIKLLMAAHLKALQ
ncbi:hypothetical protein [Dyella amyloliquefaciens]|nr:hypothetical protein [Dyella amyloliquefaciens]